MSVGRFLAKAWRAKIHIKVSAPVASTEEFAPRSALLAPERETDESDSPLDWSGNEMKPPSRTMTFFAESPNAAFRQAESELGPDVVLVATCRTSQELRHLGQYQVTFAVDAPAVPVLSSPGSSGALGRAVRAPAAGDDFAQVLLQHFAAPPPRALKGSPAEPADRPSKKDEKDGILALLLDQGIPVRIAESLLQEADSLVRASRAQTGQSLIVRRTEAVRSVLRMRIRTDCALPSTGRRTVLLAGPPGAGKTAAAARLAIHAFSDLVRARVNVVNLVLPGQESPARLEAFCALLGIRHSSVSSIEALDAALCRIPSEDFTIVDTPGFSGQKLSELEPLSKFMAKRQDIQVHLVLSAMTEGAETSELVSRFEVLQPSRLLFTMLDLTPKRGGILSEAVRTAKPLSFFSKGPSISYDLVPATAEELIDAVVPHGAPRLPERYAATR